MMQSMVLSLHPWAYLTLLNQLDKGALKKKIIWMIMINFNDTFFFFFFNYNSEVLLWKWILSGKIINKQGYFQNLFCILKY